MDRASFPAGAKLSIALAVAAAFFAPVSLRAQAQPLSANQENVPVATPLNWKWVKLREPQMVFEYVGRPGAPMVIMFVEGVGDGTSAFGPNFARFLYDEGYALGVVWWKGDKIRFQPPSETLKQASAALRDMQAKRPDLDLNRIVIVGGGEGAFVTTLLAWSSDRRAAAGLARSSVCASILFDAMDFDAAHPDSAWAKRRLREEPDPALVSPMRYVASASPTLFMTEVRDKAAAERARFMANAIESAGGVAAEAEYPRFEDSRMWTYLGYSENPATKVIGDFLRANCPAGKH
jgi:pimeloyl-ACP methyl ester carboxylesterase